MLDPERQRLAQLSRELSRLARDVQRPASRLTPEETAALGAAVDWLNARAADSRGYGPATLVRNNFRATARSLAGLLRRLG